LFYHVCSECFSAAWFSLVFSYSWLPAFGAQRRSQQQRQQAARPFSEAHANRWR
jgi:hypothetical protein